MAALAMSGQRQERGRSESYRDRRADERYDLNAPGGCLNYRGARFPCLIVDVSLSGCCVRTERPFLPGNLANVEIVLPILGMVLRMVGTTQWVTRENLIGIRFLHANARSKNQLAALLTGLVDKDATAEVQAAVAAATEAKNSVLAVEFPEIWLQDLKRKKTPGESPDSDERAASAPHPGTPAAGGKSEVREEKAKKDENRNAELDDWPAVLQILKDGSLLQGVILGLSLEECSFRTVEPFKAGTQVRVEVDFQMRGLPFRLGGVTEDVPNPHTINIRFIDMSYRKRVQLAELIGELQEQGGVRSGTPESQST